MGSAVPFKLRVRPAPPLDRFVECFWYYAGYSRPHDRELVLPTGAASIVFKLTSDPVRRFDAASGPEGEPLGGAVATGAFSTHFVLDTSRPSTSLGVQFRPGGAAPFLGVPAGELADMRVSLEDLWGGEAARLRERLLDAPTPEAAIDLVERALAARVTRPLRMHPAIAHALARIDGEPSVTRIDAVRREAGYGAKRFIELFRAGVGLAPKQYSRVRRFQAVVARLAAGRDVEWVDVALDGGYSDQSHLNREFRRMAGVTPSAYRPVEPAHRNHVALREEKNVQDG